MKIDISSEDMEAFYIKRIKRVMSRYYKEAVFDENLNNKAKSRQASLVEGIMKCVNQYEQELTKEIKQDKGGR